MLLSAHAERFSVSRIREKEEKKKYMYREKWLEVTKVLQGDFIHNSYNFTNIGKTFIYKYFREDMRVYIFNSLLLLWTFVNAGAYKSS